MSVCPWSENFLECDNIIVVCYCKAKKNFTTSVKKAKLAWYNISAHKKKNAKEDCDDTIGNRDNKARHPLTQVAQVSARRAPVDSPKLLSPSTPRTRCQPLGLAVRSSLLMPQCKASVAEWVVLYIKVPVAVWTQRIWNPGGCHATCTHLNPSQWRSSAKLRLQGINPGYLCERTGWNRWLP